MRQSYLDQPRTGPEVNLTKQDVDDNDAYVIRMQTNSLNPEWNEDVSFCLFDASQSLKLEVLDEKTFTSDDKTGDAELDLQPFVEVAKTDWDGIRDDTIIRFRTISQPFVEAKTAR
ncbi:hypothetical protein ZIOFF_013216 [Zingiber officinale]|uniref:C2 domain-containing protein n=1 Tax=Zingiber officinale TaxID=94328 RepID=A0A8J5H8W7_ZINOF|nr:hypothetical protein ZIOFF_013216 [Zingiber officinale]